MNPFSPPPGPYSNNRGPQAGFPFPTNDRPPAGMPFGPNDRPPAGMPFGPNDRPPAGMPFRTNDGPHAGMQYPTYYGSVPGMRGATAPPLPVPPPEPKRRMILPVLGGGFVGAVVLAAVIGLQSPGWFPAPGQLTQAESAPATNPVSALDLQPGDCYNTGQLPPAPGTSTPISTVEAVPCASPHTGQVIAKVAYAPADTLADVRANRAGTDCESELRQKVALATLTDPAYTSGTLVPADDTTWTAGRTIACVVMTDGPRTGSVLK